MDFDSPRLTWVQPPLSAQSASSGDQHRMPNVAPIPRVVRQLLVAGYLQWTRTDTMEMDLLFLHAALLPKLPSADLQNASCTVMVLHTALLLIKELTLQQEKGSNKPMLMQFTGLTMFFTILKQLA